jgi:hypothetical protein
VDERAGDEQAPAHPAGELVDARVAAFDEVRDLQRALDRVVSVVAPDPVEVREDEQVLLDGKRHVEVVELRRDTTLRAGGLRLFRELEAEHLDLALVGNRLRGEEAHRRRLAGAVRPEESHARAEGDVEVEMVDRGDFAVALDGPAQPDGELVAHAPHPASRGLGGVDVARNEREHHAVVPSPVRLAVRAKQTLPLEAGLLDRADRGGVVGCRLCEDPLETKLAQTPSRPQPHGSRCDAASSSFGEDGDGDPRDLLLFLELEVEEPERTVVACIRDDEGRSAARAPLLLDSGEAFALALRRERLVVEAALRLRVVRGGCDQRDVFGSPLSKHDLSVGRSRVRRDEQTTSARSTPSSPSRAPSCQSRSGCRGP